MVFNPKSTNLEEHGRKISETIKRKMESDPDYRRRWVENSKKRSKGNEK